MKPSVVVACASMNSEEGHLLWEANATRRKRRWVVAMIFHHFLQLRYKFVHVEVSADACPPFNMGLGKAVNCSILFRKNMFQELPTISARQGYYIKNWPGLCRSKKNEKKSSDNIHGKTSNIFVKSHSAKLLWVLRVGIHQISKAKYINGDWLTALYPCISTLIKLRAEMNHFIGLDIAMSFYFSNNGSNLRARLDLMECR